MAELFRVLRRVELDHDVHQGQVEPARGQVRAEQDGCGVRRRRNRGYEGVEVLGAFGRGEGAVQGREVERGFLQRGEGAEDLVKSDREL